MLSSCLSTWTLSAAGPAATLSAALLLALPCGAATDDARAWQLIGLAGLTNNPRGVCVVAEGGDLAFALARTSAFHVVSQEPDAARVQAASAHADSAGLLAKRMTFAESPRSNIVVADCYANLIVLASVSDADLATLDPNAIARKLAPCRGVALIGNSQSGTLSESALSNWLSGIIVNCTSSIVNSASGLFARISRGPIPGSAEWTHRFFDAGNNPLSTDTAFRWPPMTQWLGKPYRDGGSLSLMAGGRVFIIWAGISSKSARHYDKFNDRNRIQARDAYNGQELWTRYLDPAYGADRRMSTCVALSNAFYLIEPFTANILELDPETGIERRRFSLGAYGAEAKWIGVDNGMLCALLGARDNVNPSGCQWRWFARQYGDTDPYTFDYGQKVVGLNLTNGAVLWQRDESSACIHEASVGMLNGRISYLARNRSVTCLDNRTGALLWTNAAAAQAWETMAQERVMSSFGHHGGLLCSPNALIAYIPNLGALGVNAADGSVLWQYRGAYHPLIRGDRVFTASGAYGPTNDKQYANNVFDLMTGALDPAWSNKTPVGSACGATSQSPYFHSGSWGLVYDFSRAYRIVPQWTASYNDHRNNCNAVALFAGGISFAQAYECSCSYKTSGQVAEMWANGFVTGCAAVEAERLRRAANIIPASQTAATPADWPAARGGTERAAASSVGIASTGSVRWCIQPVVYKNPGYMRRAVETAYEPAAPVVVGTRVYASGPDGAVRCFNLGDGAPQWVFYTGGRIFTAPSYWRGRLYVGSGDGFIYCLDAGTGGELWRFQAAPVERRMFAFGHLVSTWPVVTGVTIQDPSGAGTSAVAYAAACLLNNNGAHVYALNAADGSIIWQNNSSGIQNTNNLLGVTTMGVPTIVTNRLWIRDISFDLATGACGLSSESGPYTRYTGKLDDSTLLIGGWRIDSDQNELTMSKDVKVGLRAAQTTKSGSQTKLNAAYLVGRMVGFPAWDDRQMACIASVNEHAAGASSPIADALVMWQRSAVTNWIASELAKASNLRTTPISNPAVAETLVPEQWRVSHDRWFGVALASNAVIGTYGVYTSAGDTTGVARAFRPGDAWYLAALARDTGAEQWRAALPSVPLEDGLAIASDGSIVAQLLDGRIVNVAIVPEPGMLAGLWLLGTLVVRRHARARSASALPARELDFNTTRSV